MSTQFSIRIIYRRIICYYLLYIYMHIRHVHGSVCLSLNFFLSRALTHPGSLSANVISINLRSSWCIIIIYIMCMIDNKKIFLDSSFLPRYRPRVRDDILHPTPLLYRYPQGGLMFWTYTVYYYTSIIDPTAPYTYTLQGTRVGARVQVHVHVEVMN